MKTQNSTPNRMAAQSKAASKSQSPKPVTVRAMAGSSIQPFEQTKKNNEFGKWEVKIGRREQEILMKPTKLSPKITVT